MHTLSKYLSELTGWNSGSHLAPIPLLVSFNYSSNPDYIKSIHHVWGGGSSDGLVQVFTVMHRHTVESDNDHIPYLNSHISSPVEIRKHRDMQAYVMFNLTNK